MEEYQENQVDKLITAMVTILWQPEGDKIQILGHTSCTLNAYRTLDYNPDPVLTVIAHSTDKQDSLPNRVENFPEAKLSSWCRRRRPLEQQFKSSAVDEVLLTRVHDGEVQLLEGLTSNLFVVYPGGILRTPATDQVLGGYARQLVLDHAQNCGLKVEVGPIPLKDSLIWEEIFLTSSVRLIIPVQTLILPASVGDDSMQAREVWSIKRKSDKLVWRDVYNALLLLRDSHDPLQATWPIR